MNKLCAARGFLYRGELLLQIAGGQVVIFPSWMPPMPTQASVQVTLGSIGEAQLFVDAYWALVEREFVQPFSYTECISVEA